MTKILCLVLALVLGLAALASCGGGKKPETTTEPDTGSQPADTGVATDPAGEGTSEEVTTDNTTDPATLDRNVSIDLENIDEVLDEYLPIEGDEVEGVDAYTLASRKAYREALGEYYAIYLQAKEYTDPSIRYALMAIAEAKLMESAVMVPSTTRGGNYAITRLAPRTATTVLWGTDSDRFHNVIIATDLLKKEDRAEIKAKWGELKGTGTYETWVKDYLTGKGYTLKNTYELAYSEDPATWDALATSYASDSEAIVNTVDGLLEYDVENVQQPALAESYTVSEDGKTYTFKLREGVMWVDRQGREYAEITADDFVAGFQHMLDAPDGLNWLVNGVVEGVFEYLEEGGSYDNVGVKAIDKYTVAYTLVDAISYFPTMLAYNCFTPMNRAYYESKGGKFGAENTDEAAAACTYGSDPDNILYCGPYLVTNATDKNTIVFEANPKYWNKDNINLSKITWLYNDGSDATKAYNDMKAGTICACGLNASSLELAKADGNFEKYAYVSDTDATSFMAFLNINRTAFANENSGLLPSPMNDDQRNASAKAMANRNFRLALAFAFDKGAYNAQSVGEELKLVSVRNAYTPGNYVSLEYPVTVTIGEETREYAAGTWYGKIMQDQLDADEFPIKCWDEENLISDGFDGWYNVENAQAALALAITELAAEGLTIDADHPIYIDYDFQSGSEISENRANSFKTSVEGALEGKVKVNLIGGDREAFLGATYRFKDGSTANYSVNTNSGWGPDYGDPQTYLDTFLPEGEGYMAKSIGVY